MTALEMVREFKVFLDKVDSQALPDFTPTEIYLMLNEAQERYIKTHYMRNNIYKQGFEEVQKRTDDLSNLVVTRYTATTLLTTETNTYRIDVDTLYSNEARSVASTNLYMFYLRGRARVTTTACGSQYIGVKLFQQDDLEEAMNDPFNKPDLLNPLGYFEDGDLFVVTDGSYTVTNFKLTFLRRPLLIAQAQNCELKAHTHKEIVQLAVNIALENIESNRQQTQGQHLNTTE